MSGEFPRNMWGGGIWFGEDVAASKEFALWLLEKGYMIRWDQCSAEVTFYHADHEWMKRQDYFAFKQRMLDQWKASK
jgi:hypothetical protein